METEAKETDAMDVKETDVTKKEKGVTKEGTDVTKEGTDVHTRPPAASSDLQAPPPSAWR